VALPHEEGDRANVPIPWDDAVTALTDRGWAFIPTALSVDLAQQLGEDDRRQWRLLGNEGKVEQHAFGAYMPFTETLPLARGMGDDLIAGLSEAAKRRGLPEVPGFNEATWSRWPVRTGRITAHRDPREYGGIIAIFTLRGRAMFRVFDDDQQATEWETGPGQLAILRGNGWPLSDSRCLVHEVEPPTSEERMIMTFRYNSGGAGAGYSV
jgi:hypothetical protein